MMQPFVGGLRRWVSGAVAIMVVGSVISAAAQQSRGTIVVGGSIGGSLSGNSHAGVTALRYCDDPREGCLPGVYFGFGIARYRYSIEHGRICRHCRSLWD